MAIDILFSFILILLYFKTQNFLFLAILAVLIGWSIGVEAFIHIHNQKLKEYDKLADKLINGESHCPPHQWIDKDGKLICHICKKDI